MQPPDGRVLSELYDGIADGKRLHEAFEALARGFGCASATIVAVDPVEVRASAKLGVGAFNPTSCARYNLDFAAMNPAPVAMAKLASGSVVASDRFFSPEFRRQSIILQDFLRPIGIEESLIGKISTEDGRVAFLAVHRGGDRAPFDESDLAGLAAYLPHVDRALKLRRTFLRLETNSMLLAEAMDRLVLGVAVYGPDGAVHVNRAMRDMAARADGLWIDRDGILHASDLTAEAELVRLRQDVSFGGPGGHAVVPRRDQRTGYVTMTARLPRGGTLSAGGGSTILLVQDPDAKAADGPETIAAACGLPPGAARLVAALMQGESAVEYGRRAGISYDTVRHHMKIAFARTGARSQVHLVQRVTRTLGELGRKR